MSNSPRYSDAEMQAILRDASERSTEDTARHSLEDIERIAAEVGIAPHLVRDAAAALPALQETPSAATGRASGAVSLVRTVPRVATDAAMHEALALVRTRLGEQGKTQQAGGALEWSYDSGFSRATVSLVPDTETTVVRINAQADGAQFALHFGAGVASLFAGFVTTSMTQGSLGVLAGLAVAVPALAGAHAIWRRSARDMAAKMTALADDLRRTLGGDTR